MVAGHVHAAARGRSRVAGDRAAGQGERAVLGHVHAAAEVCRVAADRAAGQGERAAARHAHAAAVVAVAAGDVAAGDCLYVIAGGGIVHSGEAVCQGILMLRRAAVVQVQHRAGSDGNHAAACTCIAYAMSVQAQVHRARGNFPRAAQPHVLRQRVAAGRVGQAGFAVPRYELFARRVGVRFRQHGLAGGGGTHDAGRVFAVEQVALGLALGEPAGQAGGEHAGGRHRHADGAGVGQVAVHGDHRAGAQVDVADRLAVHQRVAADFGRAGELEYAVEGRTYIVEIG